MTPTEKRSLRVSPSVFNRSGARHAVELLFTAATPAEDDQVLLRLVSPAGGVRKLDDATLPSPARVVPPAAAVASSASR